MLSRHKKGWKAGARKRRTCVQHFAYENLVSYGFPCALNWFSLLQSQREQTVNTVWREDRQSLSIRYWNCTGTAMPSPARGWAMGGVTCFQLKWAGLAGTIVVGGGCLGKGCLVLQQPPWNGPLLRPAAGQPPRWQQALPGSHTEYCSSLFLQQYIITKTDPS